MASRDVVEFALSAGDYATQATPEPALVRSSASQHLDDSPRAIFGEVLMNSF